MRRFVFLLWLIPSLASADNPCQSYSREALRICKAIELRLNEFCLTSPVLADEERQECLAYGLSEPGLRNAILSELSAESNRPRPRIVRLVPLGGDNYLLDE